MRHANGKETPTVGRLAAHRKAGSGPSFHSPTDWHWTGPAPTRTLQDVGRKAPPRIRLILVTRAQRPDPAWWTVVAIGRELAATHEVRVAVVGPMGARKEPSFDPGPIEYRWLRSPREAGFEGVARRDPGPWIPLPQANGRGLAEAIDDISLDADVMVFLGHDDQLVESLQRVTKPAVLFPMIGSAKGVTATMVAGLETVAAVACLSPGEDAVVQGIAPGRPIIQVSPAVVDGPSVDVPEIVRRRREVGPIALAISRATFDNDFDRLVFNWCGYLDRPRTRQRTIVVIGGRRDSIPPRPDMILIREATLEAVRGCLRNASYLIVAGADQPAQVLIAEAWRAGVPILASDANEALAADLRASGGGIVYGTLEEFIDGANALGADGHHSLAEAGRAWLDRCHRLSVSRAVEQLLDRAAPAGDEPNERSG